MFGLQTLVLLWRFHPIVNTAPRWEPSRLKTRDMRLNTKSSRAMFLLPCSFYLNSYLSVRTSFLYYWIELIYSSSCVNNLSNLFVFTKKQTFFGVSSCICIINAYAFKWWNIHQLWCILLESRWIGPLDLISSVRYCCFGIYLFLSIIKLTVLINVSYSIFECITEIHIVYIKFTYSVSWTESYSF